MRRRCPRGADRRLGDALDGVDASVGGPVRAPIDGTYDLVVEVEEVSQSCSRSSSLVESVVTATCMIVPKGMDLRVAVLRVQKAPIYGGGFLPTADVRLHVRCRAIGQNRARISFRAKLE